MKISFSKLCPYFYNEKKNMWKDIRVFTHFCCNVAHSGNFSLFNPAIVSFSLISASLGLSTLCNCSLNFQLWRLKCEPYSQCMINLSMMKMQLERGRCCILISRGTCTISANIIVHCKRLQEYVKSIFKDEKNVLKPATILRKNHQDSKWCIQN